MIKKRVNDLFVNFDTGTNEEVLNAYIYEHGYDKYHIKSSNIIHYYIKIIRYDIIVSYTYI